MKFQAKRFAQLIEAVEKAPKGKLDMGHWCGTAKCACGWYAASKPEVFRLGDEFSIIIHRRKKVWMEFNEWALHFGISEDEADELFNTYSYSTKSLRRTVIARLRKFYAERAGATCP